MASSDNVPQPLKGFFADLPPESVKAKNTYLVVVCLSCFWVFLGGEMVRIAVSTIFDWNVDLKTVLILLCPSLPLCKRQRKS